jgi:uncharacterized protein (DUF1778 family)
MARTVMIDLRADKSKRALIDLAAKAVGKSRSKFIVDAACREATDALLDRAFFRTDEKIYERFIAALDRRPTENRRLRGLLLSKAPWAP